MEAKKKTDGSLTRIVMIVANQATWSTSVRVMKEAYSLLSLGHVYIVGWNRDKTLPPRELPEENLEIIRVGPHAKYGFDVFLKLPLFYFSVFKRVLKLAPDVLHTHDFDTALFGFILKTLKGTKWIYDVHDLYFTFFSMEGKKSIFQKLLREIVRRIDLIFAMYADYLIVATQSVGGKHEGLREYYIKEGIPPEKIVTIWNVPEVSFFKNFTKLDLKKSHKFNIGFIGPQRTVSNFIHLFEAVKYEPEKYKILLVGEGKSTRKLREIVKEKYPNLDVEFVGNVDYKLVPNYYLLCDTVFAWYPPRENIRRAIAIKVFESTAFGIPVIVNRDSLMEDFVKEYKCGVAIKTLSSLELRQALASLGRIRFKPETIRNKWNWKNEERKLWRVYDSIKHYRGE